MASRSVRELPPIYALRLYKLPLFRSLCGSRYCALADNLGLGTVYDYWSESLQRRQLILACLETTLVGDAA